MATFLEQAYFLLIGMIQPILLVTGAIVWLGVGFVAIRIIVECAKAALVAADIIQWKLACNKANEKKSFSIKMLVSAFYGAWIDALGENGNYEIFCSYGKWSGYRNWVVYPPEEL
jgi:hypothetical protein